MATYSGKSGAVYVGASAIGEIRDWSVEQTQNRVDSTVMGDSWMSGKTTQKSWTASFNMYYDPAETDVALVDGTEITLNLYPEGNTSTLKYYSGAAHITSISTSASFDGMIEASISVEGNGALSIETVA